MKVKRSDYHIAELDLRGDFYLQYKANLIFLIFYLFFLLGGFWSFRETLNDYAVFGSINKLITNFLALPEKGLLNKIIFIIIRLSIIGSPFLIITFTEFLLSGGSFKNRIKNLSLARVYDSGGYRFADIWFTLFEAFSDKFSFIVTFLTLGSSAFYSEISTWFDTFYRTNIPITSNSLNSSIIMILAILISNLNSYIKHRLAHNIPAIWDSHELHHSPTQMTMFSGGRSAPLEDLLTLPLTIPSAALSGLLINQYLSQGFVIPLIIYLTYTSLDVIFTTAGHSSFKIIYPKPFSYLFMSPALHWIHHSDNPDHYDCNLANTLTIWDRAFGTYKNESHLKEITGYGVKDTEYNKVHPLYAITMLPVIKLKRRVEKLI